MIDGLHLWVFSESDGQGVGVESLAAALVTPLRVGWESRSFWVGK